MNRATFTIAERPNGSKKPFEPIEGLPPMTLAQASKALAEATELSQAEFVIINLAAS